MLSGRHCALLGFYFHTATVLVEHNQGRDHPSSLTRREFRKIGLVCAVKVSGHPRSEVCLMRENNWQTSSRRLSGTCPRQEKVEVAEAASTSVVKLSKES